MFFIKKVVVYVLSITSLLLIHNALMAKTPVAILYDEIFLEHNTGSGHPERPERLFEVIDTLKNNPDFKYDLVWPKVRKADNSEIALAHSDKYIQLVESEIRALDNDSPTFLSTGDTVISPKSLDVAQMSVGASLVGIDEIMNGNVKAAFSFNRPPGHHATEDRGMGFCIYNHAAIAAKYLQNKYSLSRVLIIDFDVHHGNGTQDIFYDDPSVFYFSIHQHPFYPGTGRPTETGMADGEGFTLNIDLPKGSGDEEFIKGFSEELIPKMNDFKPEFILISAGFDAHDNDLLGKLSYTPKGYSQVAKIINSIYKNSNAKGIMYMLEGGYVPENIDNASQAIIKRLLEL
ncbi:MAG: histone deacetylase [Methylophilaceae bacterium]|jgi:acetoin utilization deacetylase AcuC-like enzyme